MKYPLISIAIPVYNTSKYLRKCFDSAISQKYPNLEIVILNNGSTDNSPDIIAEYASKDSRIKEYSITHVPTVKESKDNCYKRTIGDWIITLDSDDAISSDYVEKMWEAHIQSGADMIIAQRVSVDEEGNQYGFLPLDSFDFSTYYSGVEALRRTITKWEMSVNGAFVHKSNLCNILLDNPNCKVFTDEYDSRILLKNARKVGFCQAKYYYTFNPNSVGKKNNWNRHKYRLNTRLGLLDICEQEYGCSSYEYQHAVTQSLGIALIAIKHFFSNKKTYSKNDKEELHSIIHTTVRRTKIKTISIRNVINFNAKLVLRMINILV